MDGSLSQSRYPLTLKRFLLWLLVALFVFYQFALQTYPSIMMRPLERYYQVGAEKFSFISASFFYSYLLFQIPAGIAVDRFGVRRVVLISIFFSSILLVLFSFVHGYYVAILLRVLMGFFCAPSVAAAMTLAGRWFEKRLFPFFAGLTEMLGMLGGAFGVNELSFGVSHLGWHVTLLMLSVLGLVLFFAVLCFVFDRRVQKPLDLASKTTVRASGSFVVVMKNPHIWYAGLACGLIFPVLGAFAGLWAPPYFQAVHHLSFAAAAGCSSLVFFGAAIGAPFFGYCEKFFQHKKYLILFFAVLSFVFFLAIDSLQTTSLILLGLLSGLLGFCAAVYILPFAIIRSFFPERLLATAMGFANMMCIIFSASIFQPLVGYYLVHCYAHSRFDAGVRVFSSIAYSQALLLIPISLFFALIFLLLLRESPNQH